MRKGADRTTLRSWIFIIAVVILSTALAVARYVYIPGAPKTEHGHFGR
jgi:hypothetical protein